MLQETAYCTMCSNHLRIKRLMEKLYSIINYRVSTFAYACYMFGFFQSAFWSFKGKEPLLTCVTISVPNSTICCHTLLRMNETNLHLPSLRHEVRPAPNLAGLLSLVYSSVLQSSLSPVNVLYIRCFLTCPSAPPVPHVCFSFQHLVMFSVLFQLFILS